MEPSFSCPGIIVIAAIAVLFKKILSIAAVRRLFNGLWEQCLGLNNDWEALD